MTAEAEFVQLSCEMAAEGESVQLRCGMTAKGVGTYKDCRNAGGGKQTAERASGRERRTMEYLGNYAATEKILRKYGFTMRKKYGQNFLIDSNILEKIVREAEVGPEDIVLEVGPGIGTLTQYLASRAAFVTAVEIDSNLIPILGETLADFENAEVIHEDIMKFDIDAYFAQFAEKTAPSGGRYHFKVVANLPYYITTPVLMKLLEGKTPFESMLFMVQKEVAERVLAKPGSKDYGALTLAVSYYTDVRIAGTVPPSCFVPKPNVESALLLMKVNDPKSVPVRDENKLFALIRASFNQRRKTIVNGIVNYAGFSYTKEEVTEALGKMGLAPTVRGEALTLAQFAELSDLLP